LSYEIQKLTVNIQVMEGKMAREKIVAGNWKMYKTGAQAAEFIRSLAEKIGETEVAVYIAPPFTAIEEAARAAEGTSIVVGAQNMHNASEGAFTGEVAAVMLKAAGARFVLIGHSERRHIFGESAKGCGDKVKKAIGEGLRPILCVGETLAERDEGKMREVLHEQLTGGLEGFKSLKDAKGLVIAYEPVWAIGTGVTAAPEQAQEAHEMVRAIIDEILGEGAGGKISILYGGSVKASNAAELMGQADIDGLLVGGASLDAEGFAEIVKSV
jgi:triosephosphate isomerase